jgi:hypothetical protein
MNAGHKIAISAHGLDYLAAHAGHDAHADRNVGRIANFHADVRYASQRSHTEQHHIQDAAAHASSNKPSSLLRILRCDPIVGRTGIIFFLAASSTVFHAGDVMDPTRRSSWYLRLA